MSPPLDMPVLGDLAVTARALVAASGAEWRFSVEGPWAFATPVGVRSPEQGWKLHVSATEASAADVLAATLPVLVAEGVPFKFAAGHQVVRLLNSTHADRASGGKFITIYPGRRRPGRPPGRGLPPGHRGPGRAGHPLRPGLPAGQPGPLPLRRLLRCPGGRRRRRRRPPDQGPRRGAPARRAHRLLPGAVLAGRPVPAHCRGSAAPGGQRRPPPGRPATATAPAAAGGTVVLNGRYRVQGALSHANKGGTYLAEDATTGGLVVIKEGRPHVGDEGRGDARARVRHEARMLALVEPLGRAPRLVEVFEQSGHVFLVEEYIDAPSLRDVVEGAGDTPERPAARWRRCRPTRCWPWPPPWPKRWPPSTPPAWWSATSIPTTSW